MKELDMSGLSAYLYSCPEVSSAYVFGSYASKGPESAEDLDVAVLLNSSVGRAEYGPIKLGIMNRLIELLSCDRVDIVILNAASPLLSHEVLKKGRLLFSKDESVRVGYVVQATTRYLDTIHLRRVQDRVLHEKIRSGDFGHFKGSHKYSLEKIRKGPAGTRADR